jgi:hypothetical protein
MCNTKVMESLFSHSNANQTRAGFGGHIPTGRHRTKKIHALSYCQVPGEQKSAETILPKNGQQELPLTREIIGFKKATNMLDCTERYSLRGTHRSLKESFDSKSTRSETYLHYKSSHPYE